MTPLIKLNMRKAAADEPLGLILKPAASEIVCCAYAGGSRSVDGLHQGDLVVAINGQPARSQATVEKLFAQAAIGDIDLLVEHIGSRDDKGIVLAF